MAGRDVCVVIPAHNSERYISRTICSLRYQSLRPRKIVVVDDSSVDRTAEIAESLGATVIRIKRKFVNATGTPLLAFIINQGINVCINESHDYVMISGSDDVYPPNYVRDLINYMIRDKVIIASGRVAGEPYDIEIPRGGGRVILSSFIKATGPYRYIYGWETELVIRAWAHGLRTKTYPDIVFYSLRKSTRNPRKYYFLGKAMKELGYPLLYTLLRLLYVGTNLGREYLINLLLGYIRHVPSDVLGIERRYLKHRYLLKLIKSLEKNLISRTI